MSNASKFRQGNFTNEMSAIFIMIGASLLLAIGFLIAFIWSVKNKQYEDDYTPSVRILFDNEFKKTKKTETNGNTQKAQ